jgi:hypothetical protein
MFVAGDDPFLAMGGVGEMRPQRLGLGGLAGLAALDLDDLEGSEPQGAAGVGGALRIGLHQLGFR